MIGAENNPEHSYRREIISTRDWRSVSSDLPLLFEQAEHKDFKAWKGQTPGLLVLDSRSDFISLLVSLATHAYVYYVMSKEDKPEEFFFLEEVRIQNFVWYG